MERSAVNIILLSACSLMSSGRAADEPLVSDTLSGHVFDHIYDEGFDCTTTVAPNTDLVAFVAALPAANHVICLKAGTYALSAPLAMPSNTIIQGMAQGPHRSSATLFLSPGVDAEAIRIVGKHDISLRHLKLDGNGTNQASSPNPPGVYIAQSDHIEIKDVEIAHTSRMSIAASQDTYLYVQDSLILSMDEGGEPSAVGAVWLSNASQFAWFGYNDIIGRNNGPGGDGGIDCYGSEQISIFGNTFTDTGESSIYTGSPGCSNLSIWNNDIRNSNEFAIDITSGANHVFVSSNYIDGTALAAMVFWQANDVTVAYNTMLNGHAYPPSVPCKSVVIDSSTNVSVDNTNHVDSGPLYCIR